MLDNEQIKNFCMKLMQADTEKEVENILKEYGFWDNQYAWRDFGDNPNNYSTIGAQQSKADAALAEKLINSIDAVLTGECFKNGKRPTDDGVPSTIRHAVAQFIEKAKNPEKEITGRVSEWTKGFRTEVAKKITVAATGLRERPSFTIVDCGEGQTPCKVPFTFMSIGRDNKLKIPFVQGKFNMGGTGVFRFAGTKRFQLVVTRRDPEIVNKSLPEKNTDTYWSVTIVRREEPKNQERSSVFRYLAPVGIDENPKKGEVLSFESDTLPIFPDKNNAYARESTHGSLIKLYEYQARGFRSHMLMKDGLLSKMNVLLADPALPIRFHECRDFKGKSEASFANNLTGLSVRLSDDSASNLEPDIYFPITSTFAVEGCRLTARIYVFKKGKEGFYKGDEGVLFVINGQTHAVFDRRFFKRKKVRLNYIADSILVIVDCTNLDRIHHEDLFMNSRDRMNKDSDIRVKIEAELEEMLRQSEVLKSLANKRREEEISEKLQDNKPLAKTLESIIKKSPNLSSLFLTGEVLKTPFIPEKFQKQEKFQGKKFPTYFHFKDKKPNQIMELQAPINMRRRIKFETDAVNDYFDRLEDPGDFKIFLLKEGEKEPLTDYGLNLSNGVATLSFYLPENVSIGDILEYEILLTDVSRIDPIINRFNIKVTQPVETTGGKSSKSKPPSDKPGTEQNAPGKIGLPNITPVRTGDDKWEELGFTPETALKITSSTDGVYDFYINEHNDHLLRELKYTKQNENLLTKKFTYGLVLAGLALINDYENNNNNNVDDDQGEIDIEKQVEDVSKSLALCILPMITSLGGLEVSDLEESGEVVSDYAIV